MLITAGAGGLGALVRTVPEVVAAARRALHGGESLQADSARRGTGLGPMVAAELALTWLNPYVYLDTELLLGSIAATHGAQAWLFVVEELVGSTVWFTALGFGAPGRRGCSTGSWR